VAAPSAHRRDEYLQAARLDLAPDRIDLELDLTPGMALAGRVIAEMDRDGDGVVSDGEARLYANAVQRETRLEIDGRPLRLQLTDSRAAAVGAMHDGVGTFQVRWTAALPALPPGAHQVRFSNTYHADIGVYLANVLVPSSDRVLVTGQDRDADQRTLTISYELRGGRSARRGGALALWTLSGGLIAAAVAALRRSARPSRT
jgi:hypothetical protein